MKNYGTEFKLEVVQSGGIFGGTSKVQTAKTQHSCALPRMIRTTLSLRTRPSNQPLLQRCLTQ
ncbi:MAG: hypothetical protein RL758_516 [Pseudomonadota bacterium]|jgi:hypothetical protein